MRHLRATHTGLCVFQPLQHPHHLQHPDPARRRWRRDNQLMPLVAPKDRLPLHRPICLQILFAHHAAILRHLGRQHLRRQPFVKLVRPLLRNPLQSLRQFRQSNPVPRLIKTPLLQIQALRFRKLSDQPLGAAQSTRQRIRNFKAIPGQLHARHHHFAPLQPPILLVQQRKSAHRSGHTARPPSHNAVAGRLPLRIEVHIAARLARSLLAKVDEVCLSSRRPQQRKASAANIAGRRIRHRERKRNRHGGVISIAATLQNCNTHIGRNRLLRHHHRLPRPHRFSRNQRCRQQQHQGPLHFANPLCRFQSNNTIPAATLTFRLGIGPVIGMRMRKSQALRTLSCNPFPSAPKTTTAFSAKSAWS